MGHLSDIDNSISALGYIFLILYYIFNCYTQRNRSDHRYMQVYSIFVVLHSLGMILWYFLNYDYNHIIHYLVLIPLVAVPRLAAYSILALVWHEIYQKQSICPSLGGYKSYFKLSIICLNIGSLIILYLLISLIYCQIIPQHNVASTPLAVVAYDLFIYILINTVILVTGFRILKVTRKFYHQKPKKLIIYMNLSLTFFILRTLVTIASIIIIEKTNEQSYMLAVRVCMVAYTLLLQILPLFLFYKALQEFENTMRGSIIENSSYMMVENMISSSKLNFVEPPTRDSESIFLELK